MNGYELLPSRLPGSLVCCKPLCAAGDENGCLLLGSCARAYSRRTVPVHQAMGGLQQVLFLRQEASAGAAGTIGRFSLIQPRMPCLTL